MPKSRIIASSLLVWLWASTAHAIPIPGLFNSGVDNSGVVLPGGSVDPHYALIASADPAYPGPAAIIASVIPGAYWIARRFESSWDGLRTDGTRVGAGVYFVDLQAQGSHVSRRIVWMP